MLHKQPSLFLLAVWHARARNALLLSDARTRSIHRDRRVCFHQVLVTNANARLARAPTVKGNYSGGRVVRKQLGIARIYAR